MIRRRVVWLQGKDPEIFLGRWLPANMVPRFIYPSARPNFGFLPIWHLLLLLLLRNGHVSIKRNVKISNPRFTTPTARETTFLSRVQEELN